MKLQFENYFVFTLFVSFVSYLHFIIYIINAQGNHSNAVAVVDSKTNAIISLERSGVTSVVDENGRKRNMNRFLK